MATKTKKNTTAENVVQSQPEQLYSFHPDFGFVPVQNPSQTTVGESLSQSSAQAFVGQNVNPQAPMQHINPFASQAYVQSPQAPQQIPFVHAIPHPYAYAQSPFAQQPIGVNPSYEIQQSHIIQMNAMQEQINQLQQSLQAAQAQAQASEEPQVQSQTLNVEKMKEMYTVLDDVAQGKAEPEKVLSLLQNIPADFWKGLALGAGAFLLYNNTPIKAMVGSMFASFVNSKSEEGTEDSMEDSGFDDMPQENTASSEDK